MEFIFNIAIGIILCGFLFFSTTISDMTVEADYWFRGFQSFFGHWPVSASVKHIADNESKKTSADADKKRMMGLC